MSRSVPKRIVGPPGKRRHWPTPPNGARPAALNDVLFRTFASVFPTQLIGENVWGAVWRIAFYTLQPSRPFVMATRHYLLWAWPKKGTLTRTVVRRGNWEATLTRLFVPHLHKGAFVVDAGANFGHYSLVAASIVGPQGAVVAFEPHEPSHQLLRANVELNDFGWLTPERSALSNVEGEGVLTTDTANAGGHSLDRGNVAVAGADERVPVHTLDSYLARHAPGRRLDLLKIDVQGHEGQVIAGAMETLKRDRPVVFCEVTPSMICRTTWKVADVLAPFAALDYEALMVWDSAARVESASFEEIEAHFERTDGHIDLVLTPRNPPAPDLSGRPGAA